MTPTDDEHANDANGGNASAPDAGQNGQATEEDEWWINFRNLLNEETEWPTRYTFKFITPRPGLDELKALFEDHPVKVRSSSRGNYVSVTARMKMHSSEEVLAIYEAARNIDDVIAL